MNRNSKYKKIVAVATAASLVVTSLVGCSSNNSNNTTAKANEATKAPTATDTNKATSTVTRDGVAEKEETVFVKADPSGATKSIIVSNWLKNGKGDTVIDDISNLKDIVNVKGDETFTADGANLDWAANGADIYYQGTSEETLPVEMKITYTLDGKEVTPEELAGKSGHVKIRFDYTNNEKQTVTVDGKKVETVVPFAVLGGTLLDSAKFTNVTVTNGKVISDGNNTIVAGIALPGLQESIFDQSSDLLKDVEIPNYIEMEADVTDFELDMTMSLVMNNLLKDIDVDNITGVDDLKDTLDEMTKGYDQILNGAKELSGYMVDLGKGVGQLTKGGAKLEEGSPKINSAIGVLAKGVKDAKSGSKELVAGAKELYTGANTLKGGAATLDAGIATLQTNVNALVKAFEGAEGLKAGAKAVSDGAATVDSNVSKLNKSLDGMYATITTTINENETQIAQLKATLQQLLPLQQVPESALNEQQKAMLAQIPVVQSGINQLTGANAALKEIKGQMDAGDLKGNLDKLNAGTTQLKVGAQKVSSGVNQLYTANKQLKTGVAALKAGADSLNGGAKELYTGIKQLYVGVQKLDTGIKTMDGGCSEFKAALLTYTQGVNELNKGLTTLETNVGKLQEGAKTLYDGTKEFKEKAIDKITDAVNDNFDTIKEKLEAVVKADQSYNTYSGSNETMQSSVKFIIETSKIGTEE